MTRNLKLLLLFASLIVACLSSLLTMFLMSDSETDTDEEVIRVAWSEWYGHAPIWIGEDFFDESGFVLNKIHVESSRARLRLIENGRIDFASVGLISLIDEISRGNRSFYWVGGQDRPQDLEALITNDLSARTLSDLKGKRIGYEPSSSGEVTFHLFLKDEGLSSDQFVLIESSASDLKDRVLAGDLDAAVIWQPFLDQALDRKALNLIKSDTDTSSFGELGLASGPDVLVMSRQWVDNDPIRASIFLNQYFNAVGFVAKNPAITADLATRSGYLDARQLRLSQSLQQMNWQLPVDQPQLIEDLVSQSRIVCSVLFELRRLKSCPNPADWIPSFVLEDPIKEL